MKNFRILTFLMVLFVANLARAEYDKMEFKTTDGQTHLVRARGLVITTNGTDLIASDSEKVLLTLKLTSVASMELTNYFANVEDIKTDVEGTVTAFSLDGKNVGQFDSLNEARQQLAPGVYVIKASTGQTFKLSIGK